MRLPLMAQWRLSAERLPSRLLEGDAQPAAFALPGAQEIAAMLGTPADAPSPSPSPRLTLPTLLPPDVGGKATLWREIDFGALGSGHAALLIERPVGLRRVTLDGRALSPAPALCPAGDPGVRAYDLTNALRRGRRLRLGLHFGAQRPAGISGSVVLRVTPSARIIRLTLTPAPDTQRLWLEATITAQDAGRYALCAQVSAQGRAGRPHETLLDLARGETARAGLHIPVAAARFAPGTPYVLPVLKVTLLRRIHQSAGLPCDDLALPFGFRGAPARADVPLHAADLQTQPQTLARDLAALRIPAVSLYVPAPHAHYVALARAGIAVRQWTLGNDTLRERLARFPCVTTLGTPPPEALQAPTPEEAAWALCGLVGVPRPLPPDATPAELLCEAAGREIDPQESDTRDVLRWLRALHVRLLAEAARQQRYDGSLCAAGEWRVPDVAAALQTAYAPAHLSALPQRGAWWADTRFSAALHAFTEGVRGSGALSVHVTLENADGAVLAEQHLPCPEEGGALGAFEAKLPPHACVLELNCRLLCGKHVVEQSVLPVYVGLRGMLEAAFAAP